MSRLAIVLSLSALAYGCSDERPMHYRVISRSMEPEFVIGDKVLVVPYSDIPKVGDVVLLEHPDYNMPLLHRVVIVDGNTIQTKGDANVIYDKAVHRSAIIGQAFKE